MKTIRVYVVDNRAHTPPDDTLDGLVLSRLAQYYNVVIDPKTPQIVFGDIFGSMIGKYDAIRVSLSRENYAPDFNLYDYAITIVQDFSFKDRVHNLPVIIFQKQERNALLAVENRKEFTEADLAAKTGFCSFVQANPIPSRVEFFNKLSAYKRVDSGGRLMNNVGGPVADKLAFQASRKFAISFLNEINYTAQDRPLTEFASRTMPIFWGNPDIGEIYNTKAFVNVMDYPSFDAAIEAVKEIDQDDARYIEMMNEPVFAPKVNITLENELRRLDDYLINIVENGSRCSQGSGHRRFEKWSYYGRRRQVFLLDFVHRFQPTLDVLFASRPGQAVRKGLIRAYKIVERRQGDYGK